MQSYRGEYLSIEQARVFDLPDELPPIAVAIGGPQAARIAAELGDGIFTTDPDPDLVQAYADAGGIRPQVHRGPARLGARRGRGGGVRARALPLRAARLEGPARADRTRPTSSRRPRSSASTTSREAFACGPDPERHLEVAREFADAGFDHLALVNAGPDVDGFFDFYAEELAGPLRELEPGGS